ncbi:MAG TPA: hypothetical protein VFB21_22720 [Chthonomonadaceae bacterium]|nr:hypothetical protein [Chthonomonadaceae bacterium]
MKRALPIVLDTLHALALGVWLGGLVVLWGIVPSVVPAASLSEAARRFGGLVQFCGLVMLGVQFALRRRYQRDRAGFIGDGVRQLLTFGALFLAVLARYGSNSASVSAFLGLAAVQILLLVGITALTLWLQLPHPTPAPTQKPAPASSARRAAK